MKIIEKIDCSNILSYDYISGLDIDEIIEKLASFSKDFDIYERIQVQVEYDYCLGEETIQYYGTREETSEEKKKRLAQKKRKKEVAEKRKQRRKEKELKQLARLKAKYE